MQCFWLRIFRVFANTPKQKQRETRLSVTTGQISDLEAGSTTTKYDSGQPLFKTLCEVVREAGDLKGTFTIFTGDYCPVIGKHYGSCHRRYPTRQEMKKIIIHARLLMDGTSLCYARHPFAVPNVNNPRPNQLIIRLNLCSMNPATPEIDF